MKHHHHHEAHMITIHEADLVTLTGHTLPSLAQIARKETAVQFEGDDAGVLVLTEPTPENLLRFEIAMTKQAEVAKEAALVAARLRQSPR